MASKKSKQKEPTTNTELLTEITKISSRLGKVEEGLSEVNLNILSTKEELHRGILDNREILINLNKNVKQLKKAWNQSPYSTIIVFCIFVFIIFFLIKLIWLH